MEDVGGRNALDKAAGTVGVLLAGGQARRMGSGDKCLRLLAGRSLLARAIERARPQVATLLLSANGEPARFAAFGLTVIADPPGAAGPLAGVLAGMAWARLHRPDAAWLASFATDTPLFPVDLVARLHGAVAECGAEIGLASSIGRTHPVFGLWSTRLAIELAQSLAAGERAIGRWAARHRTAEVEFTVDDLDPFLNLNTPAELATVERLLAGAKP